MNLFSWMFTAAADIQKLRDLEAKIENFNARFVAVEAKVMEFDKQLFPAAVQPAPAEPVPAPSQPSDS